MPQRIRGRPKHRTEAPRILEADNETVAEAKIHVVVVLRRDVVAHQAQTAGHAEVDQHRAGGGSQQEIFCPPIDAQHAGAFELGLQSRRYRPAKPRLTHRDVDDALAGDVGLDAAAGGFDFRKLRHRAGAAQMWSGKPRPAAIRCRTSTAAAPMAASSSATMTSPLNAWGR